MTGREALIALNLTMDIGSRRLDKLLEHFGEPENIFQASPDRLCSVHGISRHCSYSISGFDPAILEKEMSLADSMGIKIITIYDREYPKNLSYIPDKPLVLYIKGDFAEADALAIAMVGCRSPSYYGMEQAGLFAGEFARRGITVVSGLARGIDTFSHEGALKAGGRTLAVVGSGLSRTYPPENTGLADRISRSGAVISEFPLEREPKRQNFPRRNRIISGLSLGVFVLEAGRNSGSLITADFAAEQGRDVFALPGKIDTLQSRGANSLIGEGACIVSCIEDILDNLPFPASVVRSQPCAAKGDNPGREGLSCAESTLYNIITCRPVSMDEIAQRSGLELSRLAEVLLSLQIKKAVRQLSPGIFIRSNNVS